MPSHRVPRGVINAVADWPEIGCVGHYRRKRLPFDLASFGGSESLRSLSDIGATERA